MYVGRQWGLLNHVPNGYVYMYYMCIWDLTECHNSHKKKDVQEFQWRRVEVISPKNYILIID